jgi:hypothetical protein
MVTGELKATMTLLSLLVLGNGAYSQIPITIVNVHLLTMMYYNQSSSRSMRQPGQERSTYDLLQNCRAKGVKTR